MKINYLYFSIALFLIFCSCSEERDLTYQGDDVIEFSNPITGINQKLTGPSIGGQSREGDNQNIPIRGTQDSVVVQLVGRQKDTPIVVHYSISEGNAVAGEDYQIIGDVGAVTIPANSSSTAIKFELLNQSEDPYDIKDLTFQIESIEDETVKISENYNNFEVSIFPMLAYVNSSATANAPYFSTRDGSTTSNALSTPVTDIAFNFTSTQISLVSPVVQSGNATASDTHYSARIFTPPANSPDHLLAAYTTDLLGDVTATTVNNIPATGSTTGAAVNNEVAIEIDGVYGFVSGAEKKGYIRIKEITENNVVFDLMAQP